MNPQSVWWSINETVWASVWNNMPEYFRQVVVNDTKHESKIMRNFLNFVASETERKFRQWEASRQDYFPATAESWLNEVEPILA